MTNEEIESGYDTTGVPSETYVSTREGNGFSAKISDFFYNKILTVNNDMFTVEDIQLYGLSVTNNKINISTTTKLINYLKAYIKKTMENYKETILSDFGDIASEGLDSKVDKTDVETDLSTTSSNPVANYVITNNFSQINSTLNNKSNIGHVHEISDITGLSQQLSDINTSLGGKVNTTDLNSHITNTNNPHNVTLSQLGIIDSGWLKDYNVWMSQNSYGTLGTLWCRKIGKLVIMKHYGEMTLAKGAVFCRLVENLRPNNTVHTYAYLVGSGNMTNMVINTDGTIKFGSKFDYQKVAFHVVYFTGP